MTEAILGSAGLRRAPAFWSRSGARRRLARIVARFASPRRPERYDPGPLARAVARPSPFSPEMSDRATRTAIRSRASPPGRPARAPELATFSVLAALLALSRLRRSWQVVLGRSGSPKAPASPTRSIEASPLHARIRRPTPKPPSSRLRPPDPPGDVTGAASFSNAVASFDETAREVRRTLARPLAPGAERLDRRRLVALLAERPGTPLRPAATIRSSWIRGGWTRGFGLRHAAAVVLIALATSAGTAWLPRLVVREAAAPPAPAAPLATLPAASAKLDQMPIVPRASAAPSRIERYRLQPPYEIVDGLTFGPDGALKTRLAGLDGPARDSICVDRDSRPWACGLQARAALNNATRKAGFACDPMPSAATELVVARCTSAEIDLARELVLAGFARTSNGDPTLSGAEQEARENERGLWNGGWTVRTPVR